MHQARVFFQFAMTCRWAFQHTTRKFAWVWLFFPLRPVDLRSFFFRQLFSVRFPEVGQTEPPPALAFSSVGRGDTPGGDVGFR